MSHKILRLFFVLILVSGLVAVQEPRSARATGPWYVSTTGSDANDCWSPTTTCATINGAIGKASSGDTVYVAEGTYAGTGSEVVLINKDVTVSGGWNADFSAQAGTSTVDGQGARRGVTVQSGVTATIQRLILQNGNVTGNGGGVNNAGTLSIIESSVTGNVAGNGSGSAIYNASTGVLSLSQSSIRHNGSDEICFVVANEGTLNADHTVIEGNNTTHRYCVATIVINFSGEMHFTNSSISNNLGGGIYNYGALFIENSGINRNRGSDGPGGIYNWGGSLAVSNSTISTNVTSNGGGIFAGGGGQIRLNNATIVFNSGGAGGGGIYNHPFSTSDIMIQNSILARNFSGSGPDCSGAVGSSGYNLIGDDSGCNFTASTDDLINANPEIGTLIGSPSYNPLLSASPAIDAGNPAGCTDLDGNPLNTDQRGVARTGNCDIGAYEYTVPGPVTNLMVMDGDAQSVLVNRSFGPLMVAALDSAGSPVGGAAIDFTAPESGPSGTFANTGTNSTSATSTEDGLAIAAPFTANDQAGSYVVSASAAGSGSVSFHLENIGLPPNDNFGNAEVIGTLPYLTAADNTNASVEPGEPVGCGMLFRSLWYSFTPSETVALRVVTPPGPISGTLSIFRATGPSISDLSFVTCVSTGGSNNLQMNAGETYYLRLDSLGQAGILQFSLEPLSAPANDNFAGAEPIGALPFTATVDNTDATAEAGEPFGCLTPFRSLWYAFTPAEDMAIRLTGPLNGGVNLFRVAGPSISDLISVACAYSGTSTNIQVQAGTNYYLRVDSFGQPGSLQFSVEQITPPANDNLANATEISSLPFTATVDNTDATVEPGEPQNCSLMNKTIWYAYSPAESVKVRVDTQSNNGFMNIYQATGPGLAGLQHMKCMGPDEYFTFQAEAGETYYFQAALFNVGGPIEFNLRQAFPPTNDAFASTEVITSLPFSVTPDLTDVGIEPGEPQSCGFIQHTVWYAFTPTENMSIRAASQSFNGFMTLYRAAGTEISDLQPLPCISFGTPTILQVEAGQTYYLQVGFAFGKTTNIQVSLQQVFPPANDTFAGAETISSVPFTSTIDITNAWTEPNEPQFCIGMNKTVWYTFTPTETIAIRADTQGSNFAAELNVYESHGSGITELTFLGCTAGAGGGMISFVAEAGHTYYFQAGSNPVQDGTLQINLQPAFPPANDSFANAEVVRTLPFSATSNTIDASVESGEPQFLCYFMTRTIWYAFTPTETMFVHANTLGSSVSGNVNIFRSSGTGFSNLQFLNCSGSSSSPTFLAEAGQTYYLQVGPVFGEIGTVKLNLLQAIPPANDNFGSASSVTSLPFSAAVDITDATNEPNEPQYCHFSPNTIWYSFTPTETMKVRADTQGAAIPGNISIYQAVDSGFPDLQFIQCTGFGGAASFLAQAGETYYLQVGGNGQPGTIQVNLAEIPTISGRVTDAVTGAPLPGDAPPFALVTLQRVCGDGCFEFVNSQLADGAGRFDFDNYYHGAPLPVGTYRLQVSANSYATTPFGPFEFSGVKMDLGDVPVSPPATIRGRAVDADTGNPLASTAVELYRCNVGDCTEFVNSQNTDGNGLFQFNSFNDGAPFPGGTYQLRLSESLHEPKQIELSLRAGEDRDLGDVALNPLPLIGSISGKIVDDVTGQPVSQAFGPSLALYRCTNGNCDQWVNSQVPDSLGRFQFKVDYNGNPIPVGSFQIQAGADQYKFYEGDPFSVGEAEDKNVGNVRIESYPVRFSEVQACNDIPATGGDCVYSLRLTNGQPTKLEGQAWSLVDSYLPDSFVHYTDFRAGDNQGLSLAPGKSKVLQFRFTVPANQSPYGSGICTRIFIGQGNNPLLTTIGFRSLFCVTRNASGFTVASPADLVSTPQASIMASTGSELEPNNSCQTAQDLTAAQYPFVLDGALDSSQNPDIDYYHFTGIPGSLLTVDLEGQSTGKGTLGDPFLGFFDSNCNLIAINDDSGSLNSRLEINVPSDGVFVMAATMCCDYGFYGGGNGSYQMTVAPVQSIGSITGVVTDAVSGLALRGDAVPFASVQLVQSTQFGWVYVNSQMAGADGRFNFTGDSNGAPLRVGDYLVVANADQYLSYQTLFFSVGEGENHDLGNLPLTSFPVRFSEIQPCAVPTDGAICEFSVKITNGLATRLTGQAWSIINGYGIGSFAGFTDFQTDAPLDVSLDRGKSRVLTFRFRVRASVSDGAYMCATVYVGQGPNALFNAVGQNTLFCFAKGSNGLTLMSAQDMHQKLLHAKISELEPKKAPSIKK